MERPAAPGSPIMIHYGILRAVDSISGRQNDRPWTILRATYKSRRVEARVPVGFPCVEAFYRTMP